MRLLSAFALVYCSIVLAAEPAPAPRKLVPPEIGLPPGESVPIKLDHPGILAAGDTQDWGVADLNAPEAWKTTKGKGVVVAVLDTGAFDHRDLRGQVLERKDFTGEGVADLNGHGTWCAGAVAAAENDWGMVGFAPECKLLVCKVLRGAEGSGQVDWIAAAIDYAVKWRGPAGERVAVISMSLGGAGTDSWIPPAIARAKVAGVIVVAAAGNDGPREGTVGYPGGYADVVCVAAHDKTVTTAGFSSRGPAVFVTGPGVATRNIYPGGTATPDGQFATLQGTSMATPAIAAGVALWVAVKGGAWDATRGDRLRADLRAACSHPDRRDTATGYGKPDLAKLVAGAVPAPKTPDAITFGLDDFTPAGRAKLLKLNPRIDGVTFQLKP